MRQIENLDFRMWFTRINGAYKRLLGAESVDSKLILRDIVGFSKLGLYEPNAKYSPEVLAELRGRQQMALHMLQHLDIDAVKQLELQNEAITQGASLNNEE